MLLLLNVCFPEWFCHRLEMFVLFKSHTSKFDVNVNVCELDCRTALSSGRNHCSYIHVYHLFVADAESFLCDIELSRSDRCQLAA